MYLDVCGRLCVSEALLLEKVDFVVQVSQLLEEGPVVLAGQGSAGFIFVRLARDPHFDNVTRRHGYSRGLS